MVLKLSSVRIMSDASFATSVPAMPIATPISACCSAGASFTPSPVIAVISPICFSRLINCFLCTGSDRLNTRPPLPRSKSICCCCESIMN